MYNTHQVFEQHFPTYSLHDEFLPSQERARTIDKYLQDL